MKEQSYWLFLALVIFVIAGNTTAQQPDQMYQHLKDQKWNEEDVRKYLDTLSKPEIFELCNQYGRAVDAGQESNEGPVVELFLRNLTKRSAISTDDLLSCTTTEANSLWWRRMALRYCFKSGRFVKREDRNPESAWQVAMRILQDSNCPVKLRQEALTLAPNLLIDGYYTVVTGSDRRTDSALALVRSADTTQTRTLDMKASQFIVLAMKLMDDKTIPDDWKERSLPSIFEALVRERGTKTPKLSELRTFAELHANHENIQIRSRSQRLIRYIDKQKGDNKNAAAYEPFPDPPARDKK